MKFFKLWSIALLGTALLTTGCDKDKGEKPESKLSSSVIRFSKTVQSADEAQIRIINQYNEPVADAQILIGDAQGSPFRDNFITTDKLGVALVPAEWTTPASVTVQAPGYIRQTLLNQTPGDITLRLSSAYLAQRAEIKGQVTQLPVVNKDKLIDFALVMPAMTRADLLNFDFGQVISPYTDILSAAGQEGEVPSNVSIPKQSESYSIITVTLNKPVYRLKVPTLGPKRLVAARGRFVFKTVVDELRAGKPFSDLINHFSILGGSLRDTVVTGPSTLLDIPGTEMTFDSAIQVASPAVAADELLLVLSTSDVSGTLIPTDVKRVTAGQPTKLQTLTGKPGYVVSVLKKAADFGAAGSDRMSASFLPPANSSQKLLPLIASPAVTNNGNFSIRSPSLPAVAGINPIATSIAISDLTEITDGAKKILITVKKWEVIGSGWNQQVNLPKWPLEAGTARKRVELNFVGSTTSDSTNLDNSLIENATHVTHASTDF